MKTTTTETGKKDEGSSLGEYEYAEDEVSAELKARYPFRQYGYAIVLEGDSLRIEKIYG